MPGIIEKIKPNIKPDFLKTGLLGIEPRFGAPEAPVISSTLQTF
jgi:hypothetical protein